MFRYKPAGVCAKEIEFDIEEGRVRRLVFTSGCPGNLKGIESLVEGMPVDEVIRRLQGITCGKKSTSCPDQLSRALQEWRQARAKAA